MVASYGVQTALTPAVLGSAMDLLSVIFILGGFLIILYLVAKVRTVRSFQFEMLIFALVLGAAEVPRAIVEFFGLNMGILETYGLEIHSVSMVLLAAFVLYRMYGFFKGNANAVK